MKDLRSYKSADETKNNEVGQPIEKVHQPIMDAQYTSYSSSKSRVGVNSEALFFRDVYKWMFIGLAITAFSGFMLANSDFFYKAIASMGTLMFLILLVPQIILLNYINKNIANISTDKAKILFMLFSLSYAPLIGVVALVTPPSSIVQAFICATGTYGAMAIYGMVTRRSLQGLGSFLFMGLVGLIIANFVNLFMGNSMLNLVISVVGVIIFAGLTAYDHQKLRVLHANIQDSEHLSANFAIIGALTLYLDFLNLFIFFIRILSDRK